MIHLDTPTKISEDIAPKEFDENISKADVTFDFFGANLGFTVAPTIKDAKFYPYSQVGIANFFDVMASSDYEPLVTQLQAVKNTLILNDWGICLLVDKLAREVYSSDDEAKLFTWFLLNKIGYNVKIGISSKHIVLMHYSEKIIYATPSYSFDTKKFYLLPLHSSYNKGMRVYSYKQDYPGATKALDLTLKTLPSFPEAFAEKNLRFKQFGKEYVIAFNYNENLMSFMATYPQADYETFFNAPMQESTYEQIAKEIKAHIDGKRASVAMNFVLNFVQNAFVYERDDEQFGREKVMFAQETLIYDKSDCEDRAILFAYLMKRLFHIGVIGVKYSDHMATALYIPLDGDSVKVGTKKFVVADPTYINANIGQSMPQYKSKIPQSFIVVKRDGV
ncbi:MAG: hypothetical protein JXQ67_03175 [Campylobacterales bacterium]|nr:hypothetical protein [Campylobacterales bacterium]